MNTDGLMDYLFSPTYVAAMRAMALLCLLGAVVLVLLCFANYGRAREAGERVDAPWTLVIGTLRDSFLLALLYTADALLYRASDVQGSQLGSPDMRGVIVPLITMYGSVVMQVFIAVVAGLRVLALTAWLKNQGNLE